MTIKDLQEIKDLVYEIDMDMDDKNKLIALVDRSLKKRNTHKFYIVLSESDDFHITKISEALGIKRTKLIRYFTLLGSKISLAFGVRSGYDQFIKTWISSNRKNKPRKNRMVSCNEIQAKMIKSVAQEIDSSPYDLFIMGFIFCTYQFMNLIDNNNFDISDLDVSFSKLFYEIQPIKDDILLFMENSKEPPNQLVKKAAPYMSKLLKVLYK